MSNTLGTHHLLDWEGASAEALSHVGAIEEVMLQLARQIGATVLSSHFHQFEPHGVSGVLVLSESHLAIHTWPEHGRASLDLFTCSPIRLDFTAGEALLTKSWGGQAAERQMLDRGRFIP